MNARTLAPRRPNRPIYTLECHWPITNVVLSKIGHLWGIFGEMVGGLWFFGGVGVDKCGLGMGKGGISLGVGFFGEVSIGTHLCCTGRCSNSFLLQFLLPGRQPTAFIVGTFKKRTTICDFFLVTLRKKNFTNAYYSFISKTVTTLAIKSNITNERRFLRFVCYNYLTNYHTGWFITIIIIINWR